MLSEPRCESSHIFSNYLYGSIFFKGGGWKVNTCSLYTVPYVVVNRVYEFPYVDFLISAPYITLTWMSKLPEETVGGGREGVQGIHFYLIFDMAFISCLQFFQCNLLQKERMALTDVVGTFKTAWKVKFPCEWNQAFWDPNHINWACIPLQVEIVAHSWFTDLFVGKPKKNNLTSTSE